MAPCTWEPLYTDCDCEGTCCHLGGLSPELTEAVLVSAATWLWTATNQRFGNCPVTILPCLNGCMNNYGQPWVPYRLMSGSPSWVNIGCAVCADTCACSSPSQVTLPTPGTVTEITLDGVVLDDDAWRMFNNQVLVRTDGGSWPNCQDLTADPPTWAVTYVPGWAVPEMGRIALGTLVCQMARRLCGAACDLPSNATLVSRQGVTVTLDPTRETGLWIVDQWVAMVNRPMARVWSPDARQVRTVPTVSV